MSRPDELLVAIRNLGVDVALVDGGLRIRPGGVLPAAMREGLSEHRAEIIEQLRTDARLQPTAPCYCCGGCEFWSAANPPNWICSACHRSDSPLESLRTVTITAASRTNFVIERPAIGCTACGGSGFRWVIGDRWSVCAKCNDGWNGGAE